LKTFSHKRRIYLSFLLALILLMVLPAGYVFAKVLLTSPRVWRATFQMEGLPTQVSEAGRGLHWAQYHTKDNLYDIFPMQGSLFQIGEAYFLVPENHTDPTEQVFLDLVVIDRDGIIQKTISHSEIPPDSGAAPAWQVIDLDLIEPLMPSDQLAFVVKTNSGARVDLKIAYEVVVYNLGEELAIFLPLIIK